MCTCPHSQTTPQPQPPPHPHPPGDSSAPPGSENTAMVLYTDVSESVEWVNMCWRKAWRVYQRGLERWLADLLQPVFDNLVADGAVPRFVQRLRILEFTLDHEAPYFDDMRRRTSRKVGVLHFPCILHTRHTLYTLAIHCTHSPYIVHTRHSLYMQIHTPPHPTHTLIITTLSSHRILTSMVWWMCDTLVVPSCCCLLRWDRDVGGSKYRCL